MRLSGRLVLPDGIVRGEITIDGARITRIRRTRQARQQFIVPGFVDLHLWGEPARLARDAARSGTTSFLSSIGPLPPRQLAQRLAAWAAHPPTQGARWLGVHLEGPWVHRQQAGALNVRAIRRPNARESDALWRASQHTIRLVTLAPELPGALPLIRRWRRRGVVVSCGHTRATYAHAVRGFRAGMRCATHLWNKMGSPHQRRPGIIGACLEDPRVMVTLLVDGQHLHPTTVKLIHRLIGAERLVLETDSTRAVSLAEDTAFGLRRGQFRGQLAGTRLTLLHAVKNTMRFTGASLPDAVRMASLNPARVLGLHRRLGSLTVGKRADLVILDSALRVRHTIIGGHGVSLR